MEEGVQAPDWDSDETMIEGSVTESDMEEEELPWRRLLFDQDTSLRSEFSLHPDTRGMCKGMPSPEIQLGFKIRKDLQEQMTENKVMPVLSKDTILQMYSSQDETVQNQALLQTRKNCSMFIGSFPQSGLSSNHQNIEGPEPESPEVLPHMEKELSEGRYSPEVSLLSGTAITVSDTVAIKETSLIEPEKILAEPNTLFEPRKEVTLTVTSEETKDEESSLETFVSALERLLTSPESAQEERLFELVSDFDPKELMNPLSDSLSSISIHLNAWTSCHRDLQENVKDDVLPAELLEALNTLSEAKVETICHRKEGGSSLSARNECLEVEFNMSQTNEDCTQIAETLQDPNPSGLQTLAHQNITSCEPLSNNRNSNSVTNSSDQETACVLRRSSRLEKLKISQDAKYSDHIYKMPEKILPKILGCEDVTDNKSSTQNFRLQDPALMTDGKGKNMHSARFKSGQPIRKNQFSRRKEKMKVKKILLASINRRNIFGENLVYQAALHDDADLVRHYIKQGGNVNQPSYAGWTALHEASVGGFYRTASELLKGGADVNIKGMYQITPLHDAVMNGHYKVAELLLLNGADPLFRNDDGNCALDEAKDSCMKRLLERYIPKHQKCLTLAQRNSIDPLDIEDVYQHKKPKFSSKSHICHICNENCNRQKQEHVKVNKESKESLFININKEDVYEYYQKDSKNTKFGKSKHKQSTVNQIYSTGLRKCSIYNIKDSNTNMPKGIGRRNTQHKRTQVDDVDCNPRKTLAVSPSRRINRLVTYQQHIPQTLSDLPEESREPSGITLPSVKNGLDNNIEVCSVSKETHIQNLDLSDSQEVQCLELESVGQTEAVSFPGLSLHKEIKLRLVTTDKQPHTLREQHRILYKSHENSKLVQKDESFNKWEKAFLSFVKGNSDNDDDDFSTSEKAVISKKATCSTGSKNHYNFKENLTNRKEMDFQQFVLSEDHFSQENEVKAVSLTTLPEQEAVNFSDSDNVVISEQRIANCEQCIFGPSFDHSHGNPEQNSLACMRTLSTQDVSKLTNHVELFKKPQDCIGRAPTFLVNQTDTHIVEEVAKSCDTERNYIDRDQKLSYSNEPLSIVVHSQAIETTKAEKRRQNLESETICDIDSHSTDNMNKDLANISQLSQREKKEISHKPDEELTNNITGNEITTRNCEERKEKMESEIHMPTNIQEHKTVQNFRKRQSFLKTTCKGMKTGGINKRNARGKSRLHLAARRGNLSLVKALIETGADVNLNDNAGWTPLHEASSKGSINIIVELLKAGANVNCENIDGILPLHDAVANNHLKAAEILLQNGANPNQKDKKQKSALDEADDEKMKDLLKSYGAIQTNNRDESDGIVNEKIPAVRSKRHKQCFCDDGKPVDSPSLSYQERSRESLSAHQTLSAILQDIEEKQENLLEFEIRNPEDAEQYIEKMLKIKELMDNVLAKQKAERDDLAKKYRVSIESFKHGALREQLANLATRQKSLLAVAKKQKKISLKIQNYKNVTSLSCLSLRKLPPRSEIFSEKDSQELTSLENLEHPQSVSLSPVCGSMQETQLSLETWNYSQNTNICLNSEAVIRGEFSGNEMISKQNISDCTLDGLSKSRHSDSTEIKLSSQPVAFIGQTEYSQKENDLIEATDKDHEFYSPSLVIGKLNISETASILAKSDAHPSNVICDQDLTNYDPKRGNRKTTSQKPPRGTSESLVHQGIAALGSDTVNQMKPYLKKSVSAVPHADDSQISSSSRSGQRYTIKKPLNYSTAPKKKCIQIKDLILLGRINPGNNILEFKTQETTHKASILLNGKLKVESGQIYKNPVTWLKDLLGGNRYVTWNYAWNKVTYLGKELLKYVSEDVSILPEPTSVPQQYQPCLPEVTCLDDPVQEPSKSTFEKTKFEQGTSGEPMQSIPRYLQINEILLISDQEFLPCHIMDQHWKFCVECEELTL
ncbi:ankyrin repeat domain-containing protein 31 isoform X2 [Sapajus apella]|uniref:Ankyrin repeat domain-containing protein 31 isoform X2 n=1 Tax=Sapajus apella TaxID=9515 RepID=A0A6J3HWN6_SAPAP|nr:ankyrin repeat domain-containing protein 31 isoform X2 [Sapajus apella]